MRKKIDFIFACALIACVAFIGVIALNHAVPKADSAGLKGTAMQISNSIHDITTTGAVVAIDNDKYGRIEKQMLHYHLADGQTVQVAVEKLLSKEAVEGRANDAQNGRATFLFDNDDMPIGKKHIAQYTFTTNSLCVSVSEGLSDEQAKEIESKI